MDGLHTDVSIKIIIRMTYKEIYNLTMPQSKRADEKYLYWDRLLRVPATLLTIPLIKTKVNPTTITKYSILTLVIFACLVSCGFTMSLKILGWSFLFVWGVLDSVDGQLARCTNQCSNLGDLWDTMGGYLAMIFIYFSSGIAAFYDYCVFSIFDNYISLILGGSTAVLSVFPRLIMQKKKNYGDSDAVENVTNKQLFSLPKILIQNLISPTAFLQPILLVAICTHMLDCFILFYFIVNMVVTISTLRILLK